MQLTQGQRDFIQLWGEMSSRWGVSRTMAEIYALLYSQTDPLDTDSIMSALSISRGNANMNLRKLLEWALVRKVEATDSRRDYFVAEKDVWKLTHRVILERQKREIDPLVSEIERIASSTTPDNPADAAFRKHLQELSSFIRDFNRVAADLLPLLGLHKMPVKSNKSEA